MPQIALAQLASVSSAEAAMRVHESCVGHFAGANSAAQFCGRSAKEPSNELVSETVQLTTLYLRAISAAIILSNFGHCLELLAWVAVASTHRIWDRAAKGTIPGTPALKSAVSLEARHLLFAWVCSRASPFQPVTSCSSPTLPSATAAQPLGAHSRLRNEG